MGLPPSLPRTQISLLATAGYDTIIRVWEVNRNSLFRELKHELPQVNALEFSHDGRILAAVGHKSLSLYDLCGGSDEPLVQMVDNSVEIPAPVFGGNVTAVAFSLHWPVVCTACEDDTLRAFDTRAPGTTSKWLRGSAPVTLTLAPPHPPVNSVAVVPVRGGEEVVAGDAAGNVALWSVRAKRVSVYTIRGFEGAPVHVSVLCVRVDPSGTFVAAVTNKGTCNLWELREPNHRATETSKLVNLRAWYVHKRYALNCNFSRDSSYLMTTSADRTAKIWRVADLSLVGFLHDPSFKWVWAGCFSFESCQVLTASSDGNVRLWSQPPQPPQRPGGERWKLKKVMEHMVEQDGEFVKTPATCAAAWHFEGEVEMIRMPGDDEWEEKERESRTAALDSQVKEPLGEGFCVRHRKCVTWGGRDVRYF